MTANQMKYLLTLNRQDKKSVTNIAKVYGVNKSTVSRALSVCIDKGLLSKELELTKYGQEFVQHYLYRYERIAKWLGKNGIEEETAKKDAYAIMEGCSEETLKMLCQEGELYKVCEYFSEKKKRQFIDGSEFEKQISEGEYRLPFVFRKDSQRATEQISMANEAFHHPAKLFIKKNKSLICLKLKKMKQISFTGRLRLEGKLKAMSYENKGHYVNVSIDDDIAYIPLSAFTFVFARPDRILYGSVRLKMTCTVGNIHMPERTALLTVHL